MSDKSFIAGEAGGGRSSLARMLVAAINERETELAKVARILHDEVSQVLSAVGLQLDVLRLDVKDRVPDIERRTSDIQNMLERVIVQLRGLSYELYPSVVERAGLQFALDRLVGSAREGFAGSIHLHFDPAARMPVQQAAGFYKIAEWCLDVTRLHPDCTHIEMHLKRTKGEHIFDVRANGSTGAVTKEPEDTPQGLGLMLMEYYATQAGISLSIKSDAERGLTLRATHATLDVVE
jgi:signal transduction histidine kinase